MPNAASIAIDGPVASGKTAVGQRLASRLGWRFIDTGSMYRAVTLAALERGVPTDDGDALTDLAGCLEMKLVTDASGGRLLVGGKDVTDDLKGAAVERGVSQVSSVSGVREALVRQQRSVADGGSIVMVGRDIGTVVLPTADLKVYLTASAEVRARRRHLEVSRGDSPPGYRQVLDDLRRRDALDSGRADSPLRRAEDAVEIDTAGLDIDGVAEAILSLLESS